MNKVENGGDQNGGKSPEENRIEKGQSRAARHDR